MLAINPLKWPGMNQAFLTSLFVTLALTLAVVPYGKRRKVGKPLGWGEAMFGAIYVFGTMFLAYGVVPHQWLVHVQNELGWRADKVVNGPWDVLKPKSRGGSFPFDINYLQIGDILVLAIYGVMVGLQIYMWSWWQKRGTKKSTEVAATSTFGRPLVRKA